MERIIAAWYGWVSGLTQGLVFSLQGFADGIALPAVTVLIFGLIGAMSPCQLTTNLGALAYAAGRPGPARTIAFALAYVGGKVTVYTLIGAAVVLAGLQFQAVSIPVALIARKALGPLMIAVGFTLLGLWRPRITAGQRLAARMQAGVTRAGPSGAYLLGVAFSLAFCPTLFWLFFGLTIPLALRSAGGWSFGGLFALGSSLPLLVLAALLTAGAGAVDKLAGSMRRVERPVRGLAATVLVLAGLHDTVVYWVL